MFAEKSALNYELLFKNFPRGVVVFQGQEHVYVNRKLSTLFKVNTSKEFFELFEKNAVVDFQIFSEDNERLSLSEVFLHSSLNDYETIYRIYFPTFLEEHWIAVKGVEVSDGKWRMYSVVDLTQQKKLEKALRFLNTVSNTLSSTLNFQRRLKKFAETVVPTMADWCAIDMVGEDRNIERVALAHVDPHKVKLAQELAKQYYQSSNYTQGAGQVIQSGEILYIPDVTLGVLQKSIKDKKIRQLLKDLNLHSVVIVPLKSRGRTIGAVTFIWSDSGKRYDQFDVDFLELLCQRVSLLIDNALLFEQSQSELERQKSIQRQLKQQEETLRLSLEAGNMGVWDWDLKTNALSWTEGLERIHGLKKGEFSGNFTDYKEMIHSQDLKRFRTEIDEAVKEKAEFSSEFRIVWKDKSIHWMLGRGKMFEDEKGSHARMIGIGMDITEKKVAEEKLKHSEKKFKAIFDTALDGILMTDNKGKVVEANEAALQLFQLNHHEFLTKTLLNEISLENDQEVEEMWATLQKSGTQRGEFQIALGDGSTRTIEYHATAEIFPNQTLLMLRDISDRKVEEKRQEHFLSIASHELKNPLASIKAFVQLLKRYQKETADEKIHQYLEKVDAKADSLGMLINDLLDITRIRQGKLEFFYEFFAFDELLEDVIEDIRVTSKTHQIILKGKTNVEIMADKNRIGQVIQNIIRNAIKYSPDADKVVVGIKSDDSGVILSVRDYGIGIVKKDMTKIFQLYYRGDNHKGDNIYGLGVGLYISSQIIRQHSGKIWAKSEEGKGTTFYVSLPFQPKQVQ